MSEDHSDVVVDELCALVHTRLTELLPADVIKQLSETSSNQLDEPRSVFSQV